MSGENKYDIVSNRILSILQREKAFSEEKKVAGKKIVDEIFSESPGLSYNTIYAYMSDNARKRLNNVVSGRNRGGYWIDNSINASSEGATTPKEETKITIEKNSIYEIHLYPLLKNWMMARCQYKYVNIVANNKKGGVWGNPDIVALDVTDYIGLFDIEVVSIEAKISIYDWRRLIFEAVSHKRFSNRVYFAFRVIKDSEFDQATADEMSSYAEKYNIGLIKIVLPDDAMKKLSSLSVDDESKFVEYYDSIEEIHPPPYENVPVSVKAKFIRETLGIITKEDMFDFGRKA